MPGINAIRPYAFRARLYNAFDADNFWGPSDSDTRHVAVINFVYQWPWLRQNATWVGKAMGGWQVTGVSQFQTGTPFTVGTGDDFAGIGSSDSQPWEIGGNPALPRGDRKFSSSAADANYYFLSRNNDGTAIFATPAAGTFSRTQTRNTLYNPGFQNWNLALFKDFRVTEGHRISIRGEFFNWLNHPNWSAPVANPRSAAFGKVNSKSSERNVQLSLRYSF